MVAGLSHDLNNPLGAISGYSELLEQRITEEKALDTLKKFQSVTEICVKIVQDLLSFTRKEELKRERADINQFIRKSIELQLAQDKAGAINVDTQLNPQLPDISVDPTQMLCVFNNIINNSIQAMNGTGKIKVSCDCRDNWLEVAFEDNGPGIPEENLKKIFDPFFTTKERGKGTGLGLSTCFGVVKAHGGEIIPRSQAGQGTTFKIRLPRDETAALETTGV